MIKKIAIKLSSGRLGVIAQAAGSRSDKCLTNYSLSENVLVRKFSVKNIKFGTKNSTLRNNRKGGGRKLVFFSVAVSPLLEICSFHCLTFLTQDADAS